MSTTELSMKLVVDVASRRVVFAEATKDVVDYLHSLIFAPGASLAFGDEGPDSCFGNLSHSVGVLMEAAAAAAATDGGTVSRPPPPPPAHAAERFFLCSERRGCGCDGYVTCARGARCPSCGGEMAAAAPCGSPGAGASAGVAGRQGAPAVRCILMDNLVAVPASGSGLAFVGSVTATMLRGMAVQLQEWTVPIGDTEGLAILEASLQSNAALTGAFLREKAPNYA
ncbi:hypothetical protein ACP70R_030499 [Stipagrostis hirtigluma subsp. patula]